MRPLKALVLLLSIVATAQAQYNVQIETDGAAVIGQYTTISVKLIPNGSNYELGGFDLDIAYQNTRMSFFSATPGSFLNSCGWEYFTYRLKSNYPGCCENCPPLGTVELIAVANLANGSTPSCFSASQPAEIARITYQVANDGGLEGIYSPIDFYWRPEANLCGINTFSSKTGNLLYGANNVYKADSTTFDTTFNCSGPPDNCPGLLREFNFYGGGVTFIQGDTSDRGDLNLNAIKYEPGDAQVYANYFIFGPSAFAINPDRQIAASEVNCDDMVLTVADLVYLIRIMVGDEQPGLPCYLRSPEKNQTPIQATSVIGDTVAFPGASGNPGQQRVPFNVNVSNFQTLSGLQTRITYNPAYLTPHLDAGIGDGKSVEFTALGRAAAYDAHGTVQVYTPEPGVIIVRFFPDGGTDGSVISAGSGSIIKFNMDVKPTPPLPSTTPIQFVTSGYDYNLFADQSGSAAIQPEIVNGTFSVTYPSPSCPVLFTFDGQKFVEEDVLLTACQESNYKDVVTDYYQIKAQPSTAAGIVSFQLKEMEDEISYVHNLKLITVDHNIGTKVACDVNGQIFAFDNSFISPLSAIDHHGTDRLSEIISDDDLVFESQEPGYLVLTFPNTSNSNALMLSAGPKPLCVFDKPTQSNDRPEFNGIKVEYLSENGNWVEFPTLPTRENNPSQVMLTPVNEVISASNICIRVSWVDDYRSNVIRQLNPTNERVFIKEFTIADFKLSNNVMSKWAGFVEGSPLTLRKGESFDFSFAVDPNTDRGMKRDFIIQATGRYEPDYAIYNNLLPNTVTLFNNYPNPFNPSTVISYSLPTADQVRLEIFNILGQSVTILVDQYQEAGIHQAEWHTSNKANLATGLYLYKLTVGDFSETKKMLLVK